MNSWLPRGSEWATATLGDVGSPNSAGFDRAMFVAWPFLAFIIPAAFCWGFGDLESYFLIPASVIIIPVTGVASLIPFFVARTRGWRAVPGNSLALLLLNWWSGVVAACAIPGKLTGGGRASVLELLTLESMSRAWNDRILVTALIVGVITWVVLLFTSAAAREVRSPSRLQTRSGIAVAVGAPVFVLIVAVLGGTVENAQSDGASERPEAALERPIEDQLELLSQREEATQTSLSEVRRMIAGDGWAGAYSWMFGSCERDANPCYDIFARATTTLADLDRADREQLSDGLRAAGWRSTSRPPYCHGDDIESYRNDEGQRLCVEYAGDTISVALISPSFWGDLFTLRDAADPDALIFNLDSRDQTSRYQWNEWQASVLGSP